MGINGQTENRGKQPGRTAAQGYDDLLDTPVVSTDMLPGQYPARLVGFTPVYEVQSKFANRGKGGRVPRFNALFAVRNPQTEATVVIPSKMVSPPSRQATGAGVNSKSNLYAMLKVLADDDPKLWDHKSDNVSHKATLRSFIGLTSNVVVERNTKGFSSVEQLVVAPAGTEFPSEEDAAAALAVWEANAEARDHAADAPDGSEEIPF